MTLLELATDLGITVSDINIVPLTLEEEIAIDRAMLEDEKDDIEVDQEYQDYLESRYYCFESRGQY